jgi:hypothetical protein
MPGICPKRLLILSFKGEALAASIGGRVGQVSGIELTMPDIVKVLLKVRPSLLSLRKGINSE